METESQETSVFSPVLTGQIGVEGFVDLLMERVQVYRNEIEAVHRTLEGIPAFQPVSTEQIGVEIFVDLLMERVQVYRNVIEKVRQALEGILTFEPVLRGQIGLAVHETEKASNDIVQGLQAINTALSNIEGTEGVLPRLDPVAHAD